MMRNDPALIFLLFLLRRIVQEEIDQNRIDLCITLDFHNLPPEQLHGPNTTSADLHLPRMSRLNDLKPADLVLKRWTVPYDAERVQHLWNTVVGKHGDFVNVVELAVRLAVKRGPQVGDEDLRALEEAHFFALKGAFVAEAGEFLGEQVDEAWC